MALVFCASTPKAYTNPWTVTLKQVIVVDTELVDEICLENEKSSQRLIGSKARRSLPVSCSLSTHESFITPCRAYFSRRKAALCIDTIRPSLYGAATLH